eukprot:UN04258
MVPEEPITKLDFEEDKKMIDICAIGPLRITSALYNAKRLKGRKSGYDHISRRFNQLERCSKSYRYGLRTPHE